MSGRDAGSLLRESAPRALAAVVRRFGDFADSEDAVQEAMLAAARQWPAQGVPESPVAWLVHVASRRMLDRRRADEARRRREELAAAEPAAGAPARGDDTLALILMCCHPSLSTASAIALTLRAVAGLTTAEIASAFLVPEATMAQRISRAKRTVEGSGVAFAIPAGPELTERLRSALRVLYLLFNEGYLASGGPQVARAELSGEAIRLARAVHRALPDDPEAAGLLALMLLTDARRPARVDAGGDIVPLDAQDRSRWDRRLVAEGTAILERAWNRRAIGEYQLQAAIAAVHDRAARAEETDWREILGLYTLLERVAPSPMTSLNRAVAAAMVDGPEAGLDIVEGLEPELGDHHRLHAVRAHLLERDGRGAEAAGSYGKAARLARNLPEQRYLLAQAARLAE